MMAAAPEVMLAMVLVLPPVVVCTVCESILRFDPQVKSRCRLGMYIFFAEEPLPPNRAKVKKIGLISSYVAAALFAILFVLDFLSAMPAG